jgi:ubiquinone/menaquinone biosynthesis C-methylase UbiE
VTDPIKSLFRQIGRSYDGTRHADPTITDTLVRLLGPTEDKPVLDLGCGTGNYAIAFAQRNIRVLGLDRTALMLRRALAKEPRIDWVAALAEEQPFREGAFAGAICVMSLHHFTDPAAVFRDLSRVLAPGARLAIFTALPEQMQGYWLNAYFPELMRRSIAQMPGLDVIQPALAAAGLKITAQEPFLVPENPVDLMLYCGKRRPDLYFDAKVRANISSFAAYDLAEEVGTGLAKLTEDIEQERFAEIAAGFDGTKGDYVFIAAEK